MPLPERFITGANTSSVSSLAVRIYQSIWGEGCQAIHIPGINLNERTKKIIAVSRQYEQNYKERYGIVNLLGKMERVPLESVYTPVQFLDETAIRNSNAVDDVEEFDIPAQRLSLKHNDFQKKDALKVANETHLLMVLGGPGAGKSTFLRRIGLEAFKGRNKGFKHDCIPVYIQLKGFTSSEVNIERKITEEFQKFGFPQAEEFTARALYEGKLLILLDGLDDVPTKHRAEVISYIQNFVDRYYENRFIASCRLAAYRHNLRTFTDMVIADFEDKQIQQFINNWFATEPNIGQECWLKLNSFENTAAKDLTRKPLLLSLVCLVYQRSRKFPTNRVTLYERTLRVLLENWGGEQGISQQEELYNQLDAHFKEMMLSEIAHDAFQDDLLFLPQWDIVEKIERLLAEMLPRVRFVHGEDILKSIERQDGLLIEREEGIYSFFHITIQEYLTAKYINDHRQFEKLVAEHLTDKRWREVFLLVAGLMRSQVGELLLLMERAVPEYVNTPRLQALLSWADRATAGEKGKPLAKRAAAIAFANTYIKAKAKGNAKAIALENASAIALAIVIENTNSYAIANAYTAAKADANAIAKAIDDAIANVNVNAFAYATANANAIDNAIAYANELEQLKIFKNVNFTLLIDQLEALQAKIPGEQQPMEVRREFVEDVEQTWIEALNLNPDIVKLSDEEAKALENYFYANYLMLQCKKVAVGISLKTWETIERRMLLLPQDKLKLV